jgi:hypothetical protein
VRLVRKIEQDIGQMLSQNVIDPAAFAFSHSKTHKSESQETNHDSEQKLEKHFQTGAIVLVSIQQIEISWRL